MPHPTALVRSAATPSNVSMPRRRARALAARAAAVLLAVWAILAAGTVAAAADPYSPSVDTEVTIEVVAREPGRPVTFAVTVSANTSAVSLRGTLTLELTSGPRWRVTVPYDGGRALVEGPVLRRGTYRVVGEYVPASDRLRGAREVLRFKVGRSQTPPPGHAPDRHQLLPDTGGPRLGWLLVGGGLVVVGAACAATDRRRRGLSLRSERVGVPSAAS